MCKFNSKSGLNRIDPCMKKFIQSLEDYGYYLMACCYGHKKYPMTVIIMQGLEGHTYHIELISGKIIPRKKRFYKKDKQGYYYIPEVSSS